MAGASFRSQRARLPWGAALGAELYDAEVCSVGRVVVSIPRLLCIAAQARCDPTSPRPALRPAPCPALRDGPHELRNSDLRVIAPCLLAAPPARGPGAKMLALGRRRVFYRAAAWPLAPITTATSRDPGPFCAGSSSLLSGLETVDAMPAGRNLRGMKFALSDGPGAEVGFGVSWAELGV